MFTASQTGNTFFLICLGFSLLAFLYNSILYAYFKDKLILNYLLYLFWTSLFIFLRGSELYILFGTPLANRLLAIFNEGVQIISFVLYTNFGVYAMGISKTNYAVLYKAWLIIAGTMLFYALTSIFLHSMDKELPLFFWVFIRALSFSFSFVLLYRYLVMRKSIFQKLILLGGIYFLLITLVSFFTNIRASQVFIFDALTWLFLGYMGDIVFFSIAIGYWVKLIYDDKQVAVLEAEREKRVTQQLRFEKTEAIFEARTDERNRISMDIHDDLGSGLTKIAILGELAKSQLSEPEKAKTHLENISNYSRELVDSLQNIIWVLNSKNESLSAFTAYLREYLVNFFDSCNIKAECFFKLINKELHLTETQRRNLFLVVKESCNNIAKHSKCNSANIQFEQTDTEINITIQDNGKGFDPSSSNTAGNGLKNMQERIEQINGTYQISSSKMSGTKIWFQIPI